ncbi:MAG: hypothetical protein AVDCRST_MAG67-974, partial [uncultured Solirubrobacteraceae bacterium]
ARTSQTAAADRHDAVERSPRRLRRAGQREEGRHAQRRGVQRRHARHPEALDADDPDGGWARDAHRVRDRGWRGGLLDERREDPVDGGGRPRRRRAGRRVQRQGDAEGHRQDDLPGLSRTRHADRQRTGRQRQQGHGLRTRDPRQGQAVSAAVRAGGGRRQEATGRIPDVPRVAEDQL